MRMLTNLFKGLSDETRLQMLGLLLKEGEICVCDFVEVLDITQSKASRHLRYLVHAGLVEDRRAATWVYFRIAERPSSAAAAILALLPKLIENEVSPAINKRLEKWRKEKAKTGGSCEKVLLPKQDFAGGKRK